MRIISYDRSSAVSYAERWALRRNPRYYDFELLGGDCTNFISQCVYAGSGIMNYTPNVGWYYVSLSNRAPAWTGVRFFAEFLIGNKGPGPFCRLASPLELLPGDVIQLGNGEGLFYHSLLVLQASPSGIYIATHTVDALWRPLSSYDFAKARYLHIEGVRIP